jgi:hypothetical protein
VIPVVYRLFLFPLDYYYLGNVQMNLVDLGCRDVWFTNPFFSFSSYLMFGEMHSWTVKDGVWGITLAYCTVLCVYLVVVSKYVYSDEAFFGSLT